MEATPDAATSSLLVKQGYSLLHCTWSTCSIECMHARLIQRVICMDASRSPAICPYQTEVQEVSADWFICMQGCQETLFMEGASGH